jgi:hypothetical protein
MSKRVGRARIIKDNARKDKKLGQINAREKKREIEVKLGGKDLKRVKELE